MVEEKWEREKTTALRLELMTTTRARENPVVTLEGGEEECGEGTE